MTYILNTMESLEASRWHNEAFFVCIIIHQLSRIPIQWQYWRRPTGTTKPFFVDAVIHQLFRAKQPALFMCATIQPDPAIHTVQLFSVHSLQYICHQSLFDHQVQLIYHRPITTHPWVTSSLHFAETPRSSRGSTLSSGSTRRKGSKPCRSATIKYSA